jgi:trehalose/maltose hydrolase-like predicted phosphorylase
LPVKLPSPGWILVEQGFTFGREHEVESLFAVGNGYLGSRGSLAEGSVLSAPATFVAGIFDLDPSSLRTLTPMRLFDFMILRILSQKAFFCSFKLPRID